jgi:hypothetical protein
LIEQLGAIFDDRGLIRLRIDGCFGVPRLIE